MTLRELLVFNMAWEDDSTLLILESNDPDKANYPCRWLARFARSIYGDRKIRWFSGDFICLEDE